VRRCRTKPTNRAVAVQAGSDERRESLNSTRSNGGQKARRGSNGSSSGHGSIGSGSDPHAQTWTAIQTARSELDKGAKAKKVSAFNFTCFVMQQGCNPQSEHLRFTGCIETLQPCSSTVVQTSVYTIAVSKRY
jgi:hypothetical protein